MNYKTVNSEENFFIDGELQPREHFYYQIIQTLPGAFYICDAKGFITFSNDTAAEMWGRKPEIGKDLWCGSWKIYRPDGSPMALEECPMAVTLKEGKEVLGKEIIVERPDGVRKNVLPHPKPIFDKNGNVVGAYNILVDITERRISDQKLAVVNAELKAKNEELQKTNIDLDNFIYTASHDLKSPVSNIEGLIHTLSGVLKDEKPSLREMNSILDMMNNSVTRFSNTIQDLTTITKIQKEHENGFKENLNITEIINDIKISNQDLIKNAQIIVQCQDCDEINFSRNNLKSILYNLISNAIKYRSSTRHPIVEIFTEKIDGYIILNVKDNGLGLDKNKQEKLFSMFKRFHDHVEGTGIGLYLVKRIITNAEEKLGLKVNRASDPLLKFILKIKNFFPIRTEDHVSLASFLTSHQFLYSRADICLKNHTFD